MSKKRTVWIVLATLVVAGIATLEYLDHHPTSAVLPVWIRGEFAASAERYAGRTVAVDSVMIRFSRGSGGADVLPIEWIEEIRDARSHIRILDLHVRDGDVASTIRLVASAQDSSFRLQTMPDVAWRRLSDREARAARMEALERGTTDTAGTGTALVGGAPDVGHADDTGPQPSIASDTIISATRFADRDPVARDELVQVVASCQRYGCRIGIRGLQASRFAEFKEYLRSLGVNGVSLTSETTANTTLAMLEIMSTRKVGVH